MKVIVAIDYNGMNKFDYTGNRIVLEVFDLVDVKAFAHKDGHSSASDRAVNAIQLFHESFLNLHLSSILN